MKGAGSSANRSRLLVLPIFSRTSLPLSLSETSVPSERPVATPTSCAATTRSLTENDKRPAREGVRLGRLPQGHKFRARARGRSRKRSLKAAVPVGAASGIASKPREAPSTPSARNSSSASSAAGRARKGHDEAQDGERVEGLQAKWFADQARNMRNMFPERFLRWAGLA